MSTGEVNHVEFTYKNKARERVVESTNLADSLLVGASSTLDCSLLKENWRPRGRVRFWAAGAIPRRDSLWAGSLCRLRKSPFLTAFGNCRVRWGGRPGRAGTWEDARRAGKSRKRRDSALCLSVPTSKRSCEQPQLQTPPALLRGSRNPPGGEGRGRGGVHRPHPPGESLKGTDARFAAVPRLPLRSFRSGFAVSAGCAWSASDSSE